MSRIFPIIYISCFMAAFLFQSLSSNAQVSAGEFIRYTNQKSPVLQGLSTAKEFSYKESQAEEIFGSVKNITIKDFPISSNETGTIELQRYRSIADGNTIITKGGDNNRLPLPILNAFEGQIRGEPDSKVYLINSNGYLFASIEREDGSKNMIAPELTDNKSNNHVILSEKEFYSKIPMGFDCRMESQEYQFAQKYKNKQFPKPQSNDLLQVEVAIETDSYFFDATGGDLQKAQAYVMSIVSLASMIYEDQVNITIYLSWLKTWTDSPRDPYDCKGDPFVLRDSAINYWKLNYSNVKRDIAHIMTSISYGGGGYGYLDALCGKQGDYSMSTSSMQGYHTYPTFAFTYDVYTFAHELGHNFNAQHTHSCFWGVPLDTCVVSAENASCLDTANIKPKPNPGSIMSYCGAVNDQFGFGWQVRMIFLQQNKDLIRSCAENSPCITPPPSSAVYLLTPHGQEVFNAGDSIQINWRSTQVEKINLQYSTDNGIEWMPISNDIPSFPDIYSWKLPDICSRNVKVRIVDALDSNIDDSTKLIFSIISNNPDSLLAYYPFNGNSDDEAPCHLYNASEKIGSPDITSDMFNITNSAYNFDGNSGLKVPSFDADFKELTVSFWFDATNVSGKRNIIGTNWQQGWVFEVYYFGQFGASFYRDGQGTPTQLWGGFPESNQWYQGAVTFSRNSERLYLDGKLVASDDTTGPHTLNSFAPTPLYIGCRDTNDYWMGKIDDIRIYRRALSSDEILQLYNEKPSDITEPAIENTIGSLIITPNPANNSFTINISNINDVNIHLSIFDVLGRECYRNNIQPLGRMIHQTIDCANWEPGVYFCKAVSGREVFLNKFIINK